MNLKVTKSVALTNCARLNWKSFFFDLFGQRKRLEGKAGLWGTKSEEGERPYFSCWLLVVSCWLFEVRLVK